LDEISKKHKDNQDRLALERIEKERYKDIVRKLIGAPDFAGNKFPQPTDLTFYKPRWQEAMDNIRMAVGPEDTTPDHSPSPELAGYLTCVMENIANGRYQEEELEKCIKHLYEHLKSTYAVQALMGALFCRWVFQASEPMLEPQDSEKLMKYYESLAVSGMYHLSTILTHDHFPIVPQMISMQSRTWI
jgi:hypothetical protein